MDDVYVENGDNHFMGFDTRLHPTLLPAGVVQVSENMRLDNLNATVRKGIDRISNDVITEGNALTLPFALGSSIPLSTIDAYDSIGIATLTNAPSPAITNNDTLEVTGASDAEYNSHSSWFSVGGLNYLYILDGTPASDPAVLGSQTSPDFPLASPVEALKPGVEYKITTYNSPDDFTNIGASANQVNEVFTATSDAEPTNWTGASVLTRTTLTASGLLGLVTDGVFATCLFSDVETNKEYVAMATSTKCILVNPDDTGNPINIAYGTDLILEPSDASDIVQVNNGLLINMGKLKKAIEWDGNVSSVADHRAADVTVASNVVTVTLGATHDFHVGDNMLVSGATPSDFNGTFPITAITSTTFTYALTLGDQTATGTILVSKVATFEEVADTNVTGFLSMPKADFSTYHPFARLIVPLRVLELDIDTSLTSVGTTATATTTYNHGLQVGDRITMTGAANPEYNGIKEILTTGDKTYTYAITGTPTSPDTGASITCEIDVRDQFIISDIYDHRTYDPVNNLFRINRGAADQLISFLVFQEDNLVALYQRSIHIISGLNTAELNDSQVRQVTSEVGCIARKTATIVGNKMIFLSEHGVYMLEITPELNLRGVDVPLSFDIQDEFRGLNYDFIDKSVGIYFNNRYYIAVPSSGSERNDVVYIYNFLNKKWESKDTFVGSSNYIDNWVICQKDGQDRLFASSVEGALQLYEELELDEIPIIEAGPFVNTEIAGKLTTRRYVGGSNNTVKKFNRGTVNFEVGTSDAFTVTATTENPETSVTGLTEVATADEDKHKRFRINKRGTGVELEVNTTVGRPTIRSISAESTETQRANKSFE